MKVLKIVILIVALLPCVGWLYQLISTKIDERRFPPLGELVDVGGYRLHIHCTGEGEGTVVLDPGLGLNSLEWSLVQPEVAKFARVCSFDRAGYGWSEESPYPRTGLQVVEELHRLLEGAGVFGPYVLVGHSLGGIHMQLYASCYPDEVVGMVLVDSSHEDQVSRLPPDPEALVAQKKLLSSRLLSFITSIGIGRVLNYLPQNKRMIEESLKAFPREVVDRYRASLDPNKVARAFYDENRRFDESLSQLRERGWSFGDKPLVVITAGKMSGMENLPQEWLDETYQKWVVLQRELAAKSTRGKHVFAEKSDHVITRNQPEIIVEAIREVLMHAK